MKKYNKPEFEIYNLGEIDVLTTSIPGSQVIPGGDADENVGGDGELLD